MKTNWFKYDTLKWYKRRTTTRTFMFCFLQVIIFYLNDVLTMLNRKPSFQTLFCCFWFTLKTKHSDSVINTSVNTVYYFRKLLFLPILNPYSSVKNGFSSSSTGFTNQYGFSDFNDFSSFSSLITYSPPASYPHIGLPKILLNNQDPFLLFPSSWSPTYWSAF